MRGRGNIFNVPGVLQSMLSLRRQGVGPSELGRQFGVDHSTIIYHCRRNGVSPMAEASTQGVVQNSMGITIVGGFPTVIMDTHDGTPINRGRTYAEYVEQARVREMARKCSGPGSTLFVKQVSISNTFSLSGSI